MDSAQLINQDSGSVEYYTDPIIIKAAKNVMGTIDLDPASSYTANQKVGATSFYSIEDSGLLHEWPGCVWLNHPFSRENNKIWIPYLINQYENGPTTQACCITYAATSEAWFRPLHKYPQCYLVPRTNYYLPNGEKKKGVTKGSVVTYLGDNLEGFIKEFEGLGEIKIPLNLHRKLMYW